MSKTSQDVEAFLTSKREQDEQAKQIFAGSKYACGRVQVYFHESYRGRTFALWVLDIDPENILKVASRQERNWSVLIQPQVPRFGNVYCSSEEGDVKEFMTVFRNVLPGNYAITPFDNSSDIWGCITVMFAEEDEHNVIQMDFSARKERSYGD